MSEKLNECKKLIEDINSSNGIFNIMEVCGTHTMAISKFGLRDALKAVNFISGPGCPVCVTAEHYIDYIYDLSIKKDVIIASFGDIFRVPGSKQNISLEAASARGAAVKIVYSSMEAVKLAEKNEDKVVVFLGIGFETTIPTTAIAIKEAALKKLNNFYVLCMHKKMEPVMVSLAEDENIKIDGFICPGHVAMLIGEEGFDFLKKYHIPSVIAGFSAFDILMAVKEIINMISANKSDVKNIYKDVVRKRNKTAEQLINEVFEIKDDYWRGIGLIGNSGFKINKEYSDYDIEKIYPIKFENKVNNKCRCGDIIKGIISPLNCELFSKVCTPEYPVGPCMVSREGSCAAFYKYKNI